MNMSQFIDAVLYTYLTSYLPVCLFTFTDTVVENLVSSGQLEEHFSDKVRCALLHRHKHLNSRKEHHEHKILDHIRFVRST